jgi:hypothetical protein
MYWLINYFRIVIPSSVDQYIGKNQYVFIMGNAKKYIILDHNGTYVFCLEERFFMNNVHVKKLMLIQFLPKLNINIFFHFEVNLINFF